MDIGDQMPDIVIVGGGFAGLTLALAMAGPQARAPLSVVVLDVKPLQENAGAIKDGRASSITPSSSAMLDALGIWDQIAPQTQAINEIVVTDSVLAANVRPRILHFDGDHVEGSPLSHMVENVFLSAALARSVKTVAQIKIMAPARIAGFEAKPGHIAITLDDGSIVKTKLLVGADGRNSSVRKLCGIKTTGWNYDQWGIVTSVSHEKPHMGIAEEHFLPSGPFAILPLCGNRSSLVWTEDATLAKKFMALDDAGFTREVSLRFKQHLGAVALEGPRWSYPLAMHLAHDYIAPRIALVGDAAHGIHPIAGLGLNLGLRDVAALAENIAEAVHLGLDFGDRQTLEKYQTWRRFDNVSATVVCDGLNRLFSNDNMAARVLRDTGARAVDRLSLFKRLFSREASGTLGDVPKLLRGDPV